MNSARSFLQRCSPHICGQRNVYVTKRLLSHEPSPSKELNRLQRLSDRLPRIVRRWTTPLLRAPASQVISFLLLHEATAVIPLFGLVGVMHYTSWVPPMSENAWIIAGIEKFGKYARRKGWLKDSDVLEAERRVVQTQQEEEAVPNKDRKVSRRVTAAWLKLKSAWQNRDTLWGHGESGVRLLIEFGTAWAIVKALIIPRLALSVWATPWFARIAVEPVMNAMARNGGRLLGRKSVKSSKQPGIDTHKQGSIKTS